MKQQRYTIKKFLEPARSHKKTLFLVLIHTFVRSLGGFFLLTFNKNIAIATELGESSMVIQNVWYFVLVTIVTYLGVIFIEKQYDILYWKEQKTIYTRYITKLMEVDNNQYETLGTGYINSVLQKGADKRSLLLQNLFVNGVSFFFELCFAFILIYTAAGWIGVGFACAGVIISLIVMERGTRISMPRRRKKRAIFGKLDKHIVRIIMSKFEILINNKQTTETNNLAHGRDTIMEHHHHDWRGIVVAYVIPRLFNEGLRGLIYLYVGLGVIQGTYTIADFILLITVIELLRASIISMISVYRQFTKDFLYVSRLRTMFETLPPISGMHTGNTLTLTQGTISLENITFWYTQSNTLETIETASQQATTQTHIFDNFSLTIQGEKKTALIGMSGSGKSTLIKLIAGYIRPQDGSVRVDGQNLMSVSLSSYYSHIGYLTQEPSVFDGSIRENLTYGMNITPTEAQLQQGLKQAHCDFIIDLPAGLDTEIGERGIRLSGGQKQRLALAKIILKDPKIILLDEPTAALDSFSEEAISHTLGTLFADRTVIIIAHRLQTVKHADEIIVMDKGTIKERGTHDELIARGGVYASMVTLQSGF